MNKIWVNKEKGNDTIIAIDNEKIFKVNPKLEKLDTYVKNIEKDIVSDDVLCIPFTYIKAIQLRENKKYIQVFFGGESEEHIRIIDHHKRKEIFEYFKENIPKTNYQFVKYSPLKSAKKPLVAMTILSLLFVWTLYLAIQIQIGYEYELIGNGRSITAIVLGLAQLGIFKVILIFGSFLTIAFFSVLHKLRNRPEIHEIGFLRI